MKKYIISGIVILIIGFSVFGFFKYQSLANENRDLRNSVAELQDSVETKNGTILRSAQRLKDLRTNNEDLNNVINDLNGKIESQARLVATYKDSLSNVETVDTVYVTESGDSIKSRAFTISRPHSYHSGVFSLEPPYRLLNFTYSVWDKLEVNFIRVSDTEYTASVKGENPNADYSNVEFGRVVDNRKFFERLAITGGLGALKGNQGIHPLMTVGLRYDGVRNKFGTSLIGATYDGGIVGMSIYGAF